MCARVLPNGHLQGTVEAAGAANQVFEGWLELLAALTYLLGSTGGPVTPYGETTRASGAVERHQSDEGPRRALDPG